MWGSSLTTGEFAAIRSAGFEPVGQVFGAAVYAAGSASVSSCGGPFAPLVQAMYQARHTALEDMFYLLRDNVEVITAPPQPAA